MKSVLEPKYCLFLVTFVSTGEVRLGGQDHFYMETQSMLVVPVGEEKEMNVYISSQWPAMVQVRRSALTSSYSEHH